MQSFVTEVVNGETYCYRPLGKYVVQAVGICGERPTFKYTRVEITGVLERLAAGSDINGIPKLNALTRNNLFLTYYLSIITKSWIDCYNPVSL